MVFMMSQLMIKSKNMMKLERLQQNVSRIENRDDYKTGCLLDYQSLKDHYQLIAVDLSKKN